MKSKRRNCRIVRDGSWTEPLQERKTVNSMGKCILIGAGDLTMGELSVTEEDYVIAVDGGLSYCGILNVEPDLIIGDFDSMSEQEKLAVEQLQQTVPEKICRLPECKDDTDMLAAIKRGLELGYTDPVEGLKDYQSKMEAAGVEKVREELKRQLDDYLAEIAK